MITDDRIRPPRGWLTGVLLTILIFWISGLTWDGFRAHEIPPVKLAGGLIILLSMALIAHQALTNDSYRTAKATLIAQRLLMPLGVILFILGSHL
jgi:hypothetical protein